MLLVFPGGIGQLMYNARDRLLRIVARRRDILVPSLVADKRKDDAKQPEDEVGLLRGALGDVDEREPVGAGHR